LLESVSQDDPDTLIGDIGVGKQQLVEIAKALNKSDSEHLLDLIVGLRSKGVTSIIISHKLNEIADIADAITILRDGRTIETFHVRADGVNEDRIIRGMVGRSMKSRFPDRTANIGEVFFEVRIFVVHDPRSPDRYICKNSTFHVRRGEFVGFAGVMGAGRTELATALFGRSYGNFVSGEIVKDGKEIHIRASWKRSPTASRTSAKTARSSA
jgi:putative multiple sugar transport system ATP-binding protein